MDKSQLVLEEQIEAMKYLRSVLHSLLADIEQEKKKGSAVTLLSFFLDLAGHEIHRRIQFAEWILKTKMPHFDEQSHDEFMRQARSYLN